MVLVGPVNLDYTSITMRIEQAFSYLGIPFPDQFRERFYIADTLITDAVLATMTPTVTLTNQTATEVVFPNLLPGTVYYIRWQRDQYSGGTWSLIGDACMDGWDDTYDRRQSLRNVVARTLAYREHIPQDSTIVEDWGASQTNSRIGQRWAVAEEQGYGYMGYTVQPDSTSVLGGTQKLRLGAQPSIVDQKDGGWSPAGMPISRLHFDYRQPLTISFNAQGVIGTQTNWWIPIYHSEGDYHGFVNVAGNQTQAYGNPPPVGSSTYYGNTIPCNFNNKCAVSMAYTPTGGVATTVNGATTGAGKVCPINTPQALYLFAASSDSQSGSPTYLEIGPITFQGSPVYGCGDMKGFERWYTDSNCAISEDAEVNAIAKGLTAAIKDPVNPNLYLHWWNKGESWTSFYTGTFRAHSEMISFPFGYKFKDAEFIVRNPGTNGANAKLQVRDSLGRLLPDSQVPGNSVGLLANAASGATLPNPSTATKVAVNLSQVQTMPIYLTFEGYSDGTTPPTLCSVMVTAQAGTIPFTALINQFRDYVSGAAQTVTGVCSTGATVTVNGQPATVTGNTWSISVATAIGTTKLLMEATSSDGTQTVQDIDWIIRTA